MRHYNANRKLKRVRKVRRALLRSLARSLLRHGAIATSEPKAKELRPFVERLVTQGKKGTVASRRLAARWLGSDCEETAALFKIYAPKYKNRAGGYTRVSKIGRRRSDNTPLVRIEFI